MQIEGNTQQTIKSRILRTANVPWKQLQFIQQEGFKELGAREKGILKESLLQNKFIQPFYVWDSGSVIYCLDGRHRVLCQHELIESGVLVPDELPAVFIDCADKQDAAKLVLVFSSMYAKITEKGLNDFMALYELDITELKEVISLPQIENIDLNALLSGTNESQTKDEHQSLSERFIAPPFSVLDSRQGYWQDRKRKWHALGFDSQETREDVEVISLSGQSPAIYNLKNEMRSQLKREPTWEEVIAKAKEKGMHIYEGASVFDPVLCEIMYKWFALPGGTVLDPFAGGSVRGIVAAILGLHYTGIDLRPDQVEANVAQALNVFPYKGTVKWITGDSNIALDASEELTDFVFSCPPYHDLEHYSDDAQDLSNMNYEDFKTIYRSIIAKSITRLKENRFACFVVSEIRDKQGFYKNFVSETISAFEEAGCRFYNELILLNVAGSLPIRVGKQFASARKVGRIHQNVLVFYKGDPKQIKSLFPEIEVSENVEGTADHRML